MTKTKMFATDTAKNEAMVKLVKKRIAELLEKHQSEEKVSFLLGIFPPLLKLYMKEGCRADTPDAPLMLTYLARNESDLGELWQTFLPEFTEAWPQLQLDLNMTISDCVAFIHLSSDYMVARVFVLAAKDGGVTVERIKASAGQNGIMLAEMLVKLGQVRKVEDVYSHDLSERKTVRRQLLKIAKSELERHHKEMAEDPHQAIRRFGEWLKKHEAKLEREAMN